MSVTVFSHYYCGMHEVHQAHPESPERLDAINDQFIRSGLNFVLQQKDCSPALQEDLYRVHDVAYVNDIFKRAPTEKGQQIWLDPDTIMTQHSLRAALYAAGSGLNAVDEVMMGDNQSAFCAVRPPGHHASHNAAMGFCIFNNIAVAAAYAFAQYNIKRIAIVDFDVHHGNGTEDIFTNDERVLFSSSFQYPLYPNTGTNSISPHIINSPLPPGSSAAQWRNEVTARWLPAIDHFAPELILISAGFDGHLEDDTSAFQLREDDYHWLGQSLKNLAHIHCQGRIIGMLEGGYDMSSLGRSVVAFVKSLI